MLNESWFRSHWISVTSRFIMGVVFLYAGIPKMLDPAYFSVEVHAYQLLPYYFVNIVALCLPMLEILLGIGLILGVWEDACFFWVTALMLAFTVGVFSAMVRGLDISCGCFRGVGAMDVGWVKVFENTILFLITVWGWWARRSWLGLEEAYKKHWSWGKAPQTS